MQKTFSIICKKRQPENRLPLKKQSVIILRIRSGSGSAISGVLAHLLKTSLCYPVKLVLCLCRVTVACRDIARAARFDLIRDLFSACLAECLDHIEYGISVSCSQVVDRYSRLLFQFLNCADVADRKVYYMDVVADTCSIRCVIVVTEILRGTQVFRSQPV